MARDTHGTHAVRKPVSGRRHARQAGLARGVPRAARSWWPLDGRIGLYLIVVLALIVRVIILIQLSHHPVLQPAGDLDDAVYVQLAERVAAGDLQLAPDVYFLPPLYTYFLGLIFAITGGSLIAARTVQVACGVVAVALIFETAKIWFGRSAALVAGAFAALTGLFAFNEILILQSSIDPFLTALALFALTLAVKSPSTVRFIAAGLAFGACALNRPNVLLCIVTVAATWLAATRSARGFRQTAALALGVALLIAPATLRNRVVAGDWTLITSHGGLNFFIGNGPGADGLWRRIDGVRDDINGQVVDSRRVAASALGRPVTATDVSSYFYGLGWTWIRAHPGDAFLLLLRKLFLTFNAHDVPLNYSYNYFARDEATLLRWMPVGPWVILPLGLLGLVLAVPLMNRGAYLTWAAFPASYTISLAAFFVTSRYRLPLFVPLLTGAGAGVVWFWNMGRERNLPRLAAGAGALVAIAVFCNWPSHVDDGRLVEREGYILRLISDGRYAEGERLLASTESRDPHPGRLLCRVGIAFRDRDDLDRALLYIQRGTAIDPGDRWIRFHLGETLLALDRFSDALNELRMAEGAPGIPAGELAVDLAGVHQALGEGHEAREAVRAVPVSPQLSEFELLHLGDSALRLEDPATAERFLGALVARTPDDGEAHELLGVALGMQRRDREALQELETAVRVDPSRASAHFHLALSYAQTGRFPEARAHLGDALRLRPEYREAEALLAKLPPPR